MIDDIAMPSFGSGQPLRVEASPAVLPGDIIHAFCASHDQKTRPYTGSPRCGRNAGSVAPTTTFLVPGRGVRPFVLSHRFVMQAPGGSSRR